MIYIFGDLRQLRSFELVRPPISPPQRLRPLRNNVTSVPPPPEPELWLVPIARPPIIPKPVQDPEKSYSQRPLPPIPEPVLPSFSSNTGLHPDAANPRITLSSLCSSSCDRDASRNSTLSSEVEIHISDAFYDIEPPYFHHDDSISSSPVPSSWQGESPSHTLAPWTPHRASYNTDPTLPASPSSRKFSSPADNIFRVSNVRTSTTSDSEQEKWIPTAPFIQPFEYNEWEECQDGESVMYTTEGSLAGYSAGDEGSRISHFVPTNLRQDRQRLFGTRVSAQFQTGSRRGTIASSRISQQLGTFDFDALPAFQTPASPVVAPALQRRPRYRTCNASPLPPPHDETGLVESDRQGGVLRVWLVELPRVFIRRTQGKCGSVKQVLKDILSRSAREVSRQNRGEYRDAPDIGDRKQDLSVAEVEIGGFNSAAIVPRPLLHPHCTVSEANEKGKVKENWKIRWKRALTVPAFRSPLTKILSPVVTRAQWEAVIRSGVLAFVVSAVVVAVLVAVPVP